MEFLIEELQNYLQQDIDKLMFPLKEQASIVLAHRRLAAVANHAPSILVWLAEPWWSDDISMPLLQLARIHLYARILDDALDENLPIHRLTVLRAQSLFWLSAGELAKLYPHLWVESTQLIEETILAVEKDDHFATPTLWGEKNHHLLLVPLFLSGNDIKWKENKNALSEFIWLMQTGDEWYQGDLQLSTLKKQVIARIEENLSVHNYPLQLAQSGWHKVSKRFLWECEQLLNVL